MNYKFPIITTLADVLPAIADFPEFKVVDKGDYSVINYFVNFENTFALDGTQNALIRRECRGIIFDNATGRCIRRPLHKFFNLNERPGETDTATISKLLDDNHYRLTKADGSMIAPFITSNAKLEVKWGTKMGETDVSELAREYATDCNNVELYDFAICYNDFAFDLIARNLTPIFEWCSRKQRIVLDYPEDTLLLTAVRHIQTGRYLPYESMLALAKPYHIPVIDIHSSLSSFSLDSFVKEAKEEQGIEGYIIRFETGHMFKIKTDEYVAIHRAKDSITQEKNVLKAILENQIDDLIAALPSDDATRIREYSTGVRTGITDFAFGMSFVLSQMIMYMDEHLPLDADIRTKKKLLAELILDPVGGMAKYSSILFKHYEDPNIMEIVTNYLLRFTNSSTHLEEIRDIIKTEWKYENTQ